MYRVWLGGISRLSNAVPETWQVRGDGNDESEECAPVDPVPVVVPSVGVIQTWDIDMLLLDEPVIRS
jgi:hypothetical protein